MLCAPAQEAGGALKVPEEERVGDEEEEEVGALPGAGGNRGETAQAVGGTVFFECGLHGPHRAACKGRAFDGGEEGFVPGECTARSSERGKKRAVLMEEGECERELQGKEKAGNDDVDRPDGGEDEGGKRQDRKEDSPEGKHGAGRPCGRGFVAGCVVASDVAGVLCGGFAAGALRIACERTHDRCGVVPVWEQAREREEAEREGGGVDEFACAVLACADRLFGGRHGREGGGKALPPRLRARAREELIERCCAEEVQVGVLRACFFAVRRAVV